MKNLFLSTAFVLFSISGFCQELTLDEIIDKGIALHDEGDYESAIQMYEKALEIDSTSSLAHYEMAFSYFNTKNYVKAEEHCRKSMALDDKNMMVSYIILGNSLDMQGKPEEAIEIFKEGIEQFDHYLLNYNYAITCFNTGDLDAAYDAITAGIQMYDAHAGSHLILSQIMEKKGDRIKSMLPIYYFLLLEPNTERSETAYSRLLGFLDQGVEKSSEKNINISVPMNGDNDFSAAEMMISMSRATNTLTENKDKSALEHFADNNQSIFTILGELKKDKEGFWWEVYVPFFYDLTKSDIVEPFSYYISFTQGEEVIDWFDANEEKLEKFNQFFNEEEN
ncbi:tetratricopeptide repeat protein [Robertkochia solimangrovi]|uniref:tetratricopeptide repeat protein n=1 Tax=Robertkochia solimangrovi TaxID=2213046 RepID=UPI00117D2B62|nr:tetratricopeptide repeat protein [Robertkochia solimangrovi]TRZ41632.1 hypothetical protein DMZ48_16620 [Robertkochia solimangrovi]